MLGGEEECRSQAVRSSGSWFSRFSRVMEERECCLLVLNLVSSTLAVAVEGRRQRGAVVHFRGFSNLNGSSN
jgi:hypothetical protein